MPKRDRISVEPPVPPRDVRAELLPGEGPDEPPVPPRDVPRCVRPFQHHGVEFHKRDSKEWVGVCPFCDKAKFHVDSETGRADCKVCLWQEQFKEDGVTGNHYGFIKYLWRVSYNQCKPVEYDWLNTHTNRNLSVQHLREWGICKSITTEEWLVPGYGVKDPPNITQLYKYVKIKDKYELLPTPGFADGESHGILLPRDYDGDAARLYVCEGVWDGVALSAAMQGVNETELRGSVVAVPGCGVFKEAWIKYTSNKDVVFLYDNDHPTKNPQTGTLRQPALSGVKRASGFVHSTANSVSWLDWNLDGKGFDPDLKDGYDVRDWLAVDRKPVERLLTYIRPIPDAWTTDISASSQKVTVVERIRPIDCKSWKVLQDAFRLAAKWTEELNTALAVSLACVCSVSGVGEPLWVRLISPASTYKSKLCKALGTNDKYTLMDDGMNGFYSGAITKDGKDYSLVTRWNGKCLITKEGSTLFTNSLSEQIIGEARAIYDGEVDRDWKNGKRVVHRGWKGTWLLAGTPNMKDYDDNELGPRFIDCRIVKNISDDLADDIVMRAMMEQANSGIANCKIDSTENPEYLLARKLCGGYITHLRQDVDDGTLMLPVVTHHDLVNIGVLGKFVERMRSRPPKKTQSENTEIALHARICRQLVKLTQFLTVVLQKQSIDSEVMGMVYKVALDTADGWSYQIVNVLVGASRDGDEGLSPEQIVKRCNKDLKQMQPLLSHLLEINVLEWYQPTSMPSTYRVDRLRLTSNFRTLYNQLKSI